MANSREKNKEYQRRYIEKHREELNEKARLRYKNDEEFRKKVLSYGAKYYKEHREKQDEKMKKWRANNRDKFNKSCYASRERKAEERRRRGIRIDYPVR